MNARNAGIVLLVFDDAPLASTWRRWLEAAGLAAWTDAQPPPPLAAVDLVVQQESASLARLSAEWRRARRGKHGLAWVATGEREHPPDVDLVLRADAGQAEVAAAGRLLVEVAALRRRERTGAKARLGLARIALTDPLTQLPNRRAWRRELGRRWRQASRGGAPLCLAIVDLDHFKQVNDERGHQAGDAYLKSAADALRRHTRDNDFLARLGGDEFGLLMSGLAKEDAAAVVERVRGGVTNDLAQCDRPLSASAGYAVYAGGPNIDAMRLFDAADAALLAAKRAGRNGTQTCTPEVVGRPGVGGLAGISPQP